MLGIVASSHVEAAVGGGVTVVEAVAGNYTASRSPAFTFTTSPVEDDVLVAVIGSTTNQALTSGGASLPSGWNHCLPNNGDRLLKPIGTEIAVAVIYHVVTAAEDSANTVTWTLTNLWNVATTGDGCAINLRDADTAAVVDAVTAWSDQDLVTPHILPRVGLPGEVYPVAITTSIGGVGDVAVTMPAYPLSIAVDDLLLLHIESANEAATISNAGGGTWTEVVTPSGVGTAAGTGATRSTLYWSRYNGTQTTVTVADPGDHGTARMSAWRGAWETGSPIDVAAAANDPTGPTTLTIAGVTTTTDVATVIYAIADDWDDTVDRLSGFTNANLAGIFEVYDSGTTQGNGGGRSMFSGVKATAGATGSSTVTQNAAITVNSWIVAALKSQGDPSGVQTSGGLVLRAVVCDGLTTYSTPAGHTQRIASNTNQGIWLGTRDTTATAGAAVDGVDITPTTGDEYCSVTLVITPA